MAPNVLTETRCHKATQKLKIKLMKVTVASVVVYVTDKLRIRHFVKCLKNLVNF